MTAPSEVPWPCDPHTLAKHDLYRRYLDRWWPIMIRGWQGDLTYAEGFAGPGCYTAGEPGSPVIALQTLLAQHQLQSRMRNVRLLFVDADRRCHDRLGRELVERNNDRPLDHWKQFNITVEPRLGNCEPTLVDLLTERGAWGHPILAVLDTFGGSVSADLIRRIAANPGSEVIITVQPQYFSRFASVTDVGHGDSVFGATDWREVTEQPSDRKTAWLLQRYRQTVASVGFSHVLDFELVDDRGQYLYLVFGTTHERGLEKMKEAMWEVDSVQGMGYRDPRDPGQQTLDIEIEPQTAPLRRLLLQEMQQRGGEASLYDLRRFTLYRTVYKASHATPEVRALLAEGVLGRGQQLGALHAGTILRLL